MHKFLRQLLRQGTGHKASHAALGAGGRVERNRIMDYAFEFVAKNHLSGAYFEFGTFRGASMVRAFNAYRKWSEYAQSRQLPLRLERLYAFDSFAGLPQLEAGDKKTDEAHFTTGQYSASQDEFRSTLRKGGVDERLVSVTEGFFKDSLTLDLQAQISDLAVIVHIDVDLYSSTQDVLQFITPMLQDGTLILFDDYYCYRGNPKFGVHCAFDEWLEKSRFTAHEYLKYSWAGRAFIVNNE